jgi:hypothetical protein
MMMMAGCQIQPKLADQVDAVRVQAAEIKASVDTLRLAIAEVRTQVRTGGTTTTQGAGRDAVSISPVVTLTGGAAGIVAVAVVIGLTLVALRRGRALKAVIQGVEQYAPAKHAEIKKFIERSADAARVEPYLHRRVKRWTKVRQPTGSVGAIRLRRFPRRTRTTGERGGVD